MDDYTEQLQRELARKAEAERQRAARARRFYGALERVAARIAAACAVPLDSPRDYMRTWWKLRLGDGFAPVAVPGVLLSVFVTLALLSLDPEVRLADLFRDPGIGSAFWIGVVAACFAVLVYGAAAMLAYRNWRRRAPFNVAGWTDLIRHPDLGNDNWLPTRLVVELAVDSPGNFEGRVPAAAGANAALGLWALEAARSYYALEESGDPRTPWSVSESSTERVAARGHLNIFAAYRLQRFLRGTLARLQASTRGGIAGVRIEIEGPALYLSRPSAD